MKSPYKAVHCLCKDTAACVWLSGLVVFLYPNVPDSSEEDKKGKVLCVHTVEVCTVRVASLILNICPRCG